MHKCKFTFLMYKLRQSNIVKIGNHIAGEIVPWVRYLWWNRTQGMISPTLNSSSVYNTELWRE